MDNLFKELSPEELRLLTIQFLGQNLGELKELDKNLVNKTNTLKGLDLNPEAIVASIAPAPQIHQPIPQPQTTLPVESQISNASPPQATLAISHDIPLDPNQLELNFNTSPYTESVFEKLENLERKLNKLIDIQAKIFEIIEVKQPDIH